MVQAALERKAVFYRQTAAKCRFWGRFAVVRQRYSAKGGG